MVGKKEGLMAAAVFCLFLFFFHFLSLPSSLNVSVCFCLDLDLSSSHFVFDSVYGICLFNCLSTFVATSVFLSASYSVFASVNGICLYICLPKFVSTSVFLSASVLMPGSFQSYILHCRSLISFHSSFFGSFLCRYPRFFPLPFSPDRRVPTHNAEERRKNLFWPLKE